MAAQKKKSDIPLDQRPAHWFKPGQTANPGGRPKDYLTQALRKRITEEEADKIAEKLFHIAIARNDMIAITAIKLILDRVEGKALARQELGAPGEFDALQPLREMSTEQIRSLIRVIDKDEKPAQ